MAQEADQLLGIVTAFGDDVCFEVTSLYMSRVGQHQTQSGAVFSCPVGVEEEGTFARGERSRTIGFTRPIGQPEIGKDLLNDVGAQLCHIIG